MDPIVIIPGMGCTADLFGAQTAALSEEVQVSVAAQDAGVDLASSASEILKTSPPVFALCGFSLGGYLAFEIMRQAPERVSRLMLMGTAAQADTLEQSNARDNLISALQRGESAAICEGLADRFLSSAAARRAPCRKSVIDMLQRTGSDRLVRQIEIIKSRPDSTPVLSQIAVPVSIVVGECDVLTPVSASQYIQEHIPDAALQIIPNSGHLVPFEAADEVTKLMMDWSLTNKTCRSCLP